MLLPPSKNLRIDKKPARMVTASGKVYHGSNIENAAYTPTVCAERTAFFRAVSDGERAFEKIAIVGAGPAGLSCAYFLAEKGYQPVRCRRPWHPHRECLLLCRPDSQSQYKILCSPDPVAAELWHPLQLRSHTLSRRPLLWLQKTKKQLALCSKNVRVSTTRITDLHQSMTRMKQWPFLATVLYLV